MAASSITERNIERQERKISGAGRPMRDDVDKSFMIGILLVYGFYLERVYNCCYTPISVIFGRWMADMTDVLATGILEDAESDCSGTHWKTTQFV